MSTAGRIQSRNEAPRPLAYAVFDCETTGTEVASDEIVSFAAVRLDADGTEITRLARLVRPFRPIPAPATAVHGIRDEHVSAASCFAALAGDLLGVLDDAVFVAHNAAFDLAILRASFRRTGIDYRPPQVACTLDAYRVLEPTGGDHRLESLCARHGIVLERAHTALADALATVALLRLLLNQGYAPETAQLDLSAYFRIRSHGDTRPASAAQIRKVFALADAAKVARPQLHRLVVRTTGVADFDAMTREQVQSVFDALESRAARHAARAA